MEAGRLDNIKVGFIIQARMASERLPGKVLLPLPFPGGIPLIKIIIDDIKAAFPLNRLVVASSTSKLNDVLEAFCSKEGIECYRGSENDVLRRFVDIQCKYQFDYIVRLTADNPLIDKSQMYSFISWSIEKGLDYSNSSGLPLGMNMEIFKGSALINSLNFIENDFDREHVTPALRRTGSFTKDTFRVECGITFMRVTVDTPADYSLMNIIFSLKQKTDLEGLKLLEHIVQIYPWVSEVNSEIFQKNRTVSEKDEVSEALVILKKLDYNRAARLLENEYL